MKIAYIIDTDISTPSSIVTKVISQTDIWKEQGDTVQIISLRSQKQHSIVSNAIICSTSDNTLWKKAYAYIIGIRQLNTVLKEFQPDVIYMRYFRYLPGLIRTLTNHAPYIVEINTDDMAEKQHAAFFKQIYYRYSRTFLLSSANGMVFMTHELQQHPNFSKFQKPNIVIANGVNVAAYNSTKRHVTTPLRSVFIGTPHQPWHGVEKILLLAQECPEYYFDIIGIEKDELANYNIPDNIVIHGFLSLEESSMIIQKATVGIGTLSLYRKQMHEACPLKTRHYLAQGLPVILGYLDTDLMDHNYAFVLQLPNTPANIEDNIATIKTFIKTMSHYDSGTVIDFAKNNLDLNHKETRRLSFFKSIINV